MPSQLQSAANLQKAGFTSEFHTSDRQHGEYIVLPHNAMQINLKSHDDLQYDGVTVSLPQSTTAAQAKQINTNNILFSALDPISQDRKQINQKLQQRKVESARRPTQDQPLVSALQPQVVAASKPNNLQVVVTHEINPIVSLPKHPQTTMNLKASAN